MSGAAGIGELQRPGVAALLARVALGGIDQVIIESTDRLARHEGDAFAIRERLTYHGVRLFTLSDGEVTPLLGGITAFIDADSRRGLAEKVKRGCRLTKRVAQALALGLRCLRRAVEHPHQRILGLWCPDGRQQLHERPDHFHAKLR